MSESTWRSEFPSTARAVHFDHASVGPVSQRVASVVRAAAEVYAVDGFQLGWRDDIEAARARLAALVGSTSGNIAFTQNTSTGLSIAANGLDWRPGDNVVLPEREFPSNYYPWMNLAARGVELKTVSAPDGHASIESIDAAIDARTRIVALSAVQFSNGHRYDLDAIGAICRRRGVLFVVDGTQCVGALTIDCHRSNIDVLAVSAHKWMLAPAGIGFVQVSDRAMEQIRPDIVGWLSVSQPFAFDYRLDLPTTADRYEPGTENILGILGLDAAVSLFLDVGPRAVEDRILAFTDELCARLVSAGNEIVSPRGSSERSGIVIFRTPGADPGVQHERLLAAGIRCAPRGGGIRFSPHFYNDDTDLDRALTAL